jgi:hypothetical protein
MRSHFSRRAIASIVPAMSFGALLLLSPAAVVAGPQDNRVLPVDQYTSDKARQLAATYDPALRTLNTYLYYCLPWVEVQKHSIGFYKPKNAEQDDRYLSVRLFIEQDPSPEFAAMPVEQRASAMFSRYVGSLLREMTRERRLLNDPAVGGFAVLLEWQKHGVRGEGSRPVHETIAVFVEKSLATRYLSRAISSRELAGKARVLGFDGETHLGPLKIAGWDDDFVRTYKVKNYEVPAEMSCH